MCRPPEEAGKDPDVWRDRAGPGWAATKQASREEGVTGGASSRREQCRLVVDPVTSAGRGQRLEPAPDCPPPPPSKPILRKTAIRSRP